MGAFKKAWRFAALCALVTTAACGGGDGVESESSALSACLGVNCPLGTSCSWGLCAPRLSCPAGQTDCGGLCVDPLDDPFNCGGCGRECAAGQSCGRGSCVTVDAFHCAPGLTQCQGRCVDLQFERAHCGACNLSCPVGYTCDRGACIAGLFPPRPRGCEAGLVACGGSCVDLFDDATNCGFCGSRCGVGFACSAGRCVAACTEPGLKACNGGCVDLLVDEGNCGACGRACPANAVCISGTCL